MKIGDWFDTSLIYCKIEDWLDRLVDSGVIPKESKIGVNEQIKQRWISWYYQSLGEQIFKDKEKLVLCDINKLVRNFCNTVVFNKERLRDIAVMLNYGLYIDVGVALSGKFGKSLSYSGVERIRFKDTIIEEVRIWKVGEQKTESRMEIWKDGRRIETTNEIGLTKDKVYTKNIILHQDGSVTKNLTNKIIGVRIIG